MKRTQGAIALLLTALFFLRSSRGIAQVNHVVNPGFEVLTTCPSTVDEIMLAPPWSGLDTLRPQTSELGIPELCHQCANGISLWTGMPENGYFYQNPHSGQGAAQVQVFFDETFVLPYPQYRDYLQGRLRKTLTQGKSYCVSFYVNLAEASAYAIKEIGAYFDNGIIDTTKNPGLPQPKCIPQIINKGGVITDTMRWTKIEGSFIAKGTESFITIGNFGTKAATAYTSVPVTDYNSSSNYTWYLVDDVAVIESDLPADAGPNKVIGRGDSVYIGRPKEVGLECTWAVLGSSAVIGTGAGIWVKPQATTQYVVTQTLCGVTKKDTVWIGVWNVGVPIVAAGIQTYTLTPNPAQGLVQLTQAVEDTRPVRVQILEASGRVLRTQPASFKGGSASLDLSWLATGYYIIRITDSDGQFATLRVVRD